MSRPRRRGAATLILICAAGELLVAPLRWWPAPAVPVSYAALAQLPKGALAEFPFYGERIVFPLHSQYMFFSTRHWMPLVNGYSDVIPSDFRADAPVLDSFPSRDSFLVLERHRVRYVGMHWDMVREPGRRRAPGAGAIRREPAPRRERRPDESL